MSEFELRADAVLPEFGTLYHHYKGGLYMPLALGFATDDMNAGTPAIAYRHQNGKLYLRPLDEWNKPVFNLERPRFMRVPADFRLRDV